MRRAPRPLLNRCRAPPIAEPRRLGAREQVACVVAHDARLAARAESLGRARRDDCHPGGRRSGGRRRAQARARHRRVRLRALRRRRVRLRVDVRGRGNAGEELARAVAARSMQSCFCRHVSWLPARPARRGGCSRPLALDAVRERARGRRAGRATSAAGLAPVFFWQQRGLRTPREQRADRTRARGPAARTSPRPARQTAVWRWH